MKNKISSFQYDETAKLLGYNDNQEIIETKEDFASFINRDDVKEIVSEYIQLGNLYINIKDIVTKFFVVFSRNSKDYEKEIVPFSKLLFVIVFFKEMLLQGNFFTLLGYNFRYINPLNFNLTKFFTTLHQIEEANEKSIMQDSLFFSLKNSKILLLERILEVFVNLTKSELKNSFSKPELLRSLLLIENFIQDPQLEIYNYAVNADIAILKEALKRSFNLRFYNKKIQDSQNLVIYRYFTAKNFIDYFLVIRDITTSHQDPGKKFLKLLEIDDAFNEASISNEQFKAILVARIKKYYSPDNTYNYKLANILLELYTQMSRKQSSYQMEDDIRALINILNETKLMPSFKNFILAKGNYMSLQNLNEEIDHFSKKLILKIADQDPDNNLFLSYFHLTNQVLIDEFYSAQTNLVREIMLPLDHPPYPNGFEEYVGITNLFS
jgi:hypothetical protein